MVGGSAFAQDLTCSLIGTQQNVRAEGKTELLGDINIECVAADPADVLAPPWVSKQVNIIVNLPVNVTNNINFGQGPETTDARLIVNDIPQLYGVRTANQEVAFDNVTVPFPGGGNPEKTVIRISSIRGNVTQLGLPSEGNVIQIDAIVSTEPPSTLSVVVPSVTIGFSRLSLLSDGVDGVINGLQCVDLESGNPELVIREGFASAWKTQGVPSDAKNTFWESGYFATGSNNGAGASQDTQFRVSVSSIPDDVSFQMDTYVSDGEDLQLALVGAACPDPLGGPVGAPDDGDPLTDEGGAPFTPTLDASGNGAVVYKVCNNDPNDRESIAIPLRVSWAVDDTPDVGAASVTISYYPLGGSDFSSLVDPEPRFVDTASTPEEFLTVTKCVTTLLFPFVTNQSGFDTGMAISNTSEDWGLSGIDSQDGGCEIHYVGTDSADNTPEVDVTTEDVVAGEQLVWLLSAGGSHGLVGAPDFQGYVLAACDFQYAHGYAFITDGFGGGIPALAQGYLALVIPANRFVANGDAESLGH
jgi:hypothetical protein